MPLLHNLRTEPGEAYNLARNPPEPVAMPQAAMTAWEAEMESSPLGFVR